jgi:NitT/TauT family transport system ATP-binding protein
MQHAITVTNLFKTFPTSEGRRSTPVLADVSFRVDEGSLFVLVGPSGSGKSTLLRILSGLEAPTKGSVSRGDSKPEDISFVFQQFALLPWLSVFQNIELPLIARQIPHKERASRIMAELRRLGLADFAHALPRNLSGGMRQRVGIARAFVTDPKIIFMDEPFSELDSFTAMELREELLTMWRERRPTIVMVTHNVGEAIELADTIAVLSPRPSTIEKVFHNTLSRPRNPRSQAFWDLEDRIVEVIRP